MALPADTGILSRAADMDRNRFLREQELALKPERLLRSIQLGQLDNFVLLTQVTDRLNATEFPDQGFAQLARQIIQAADGRKHYIANVYRGLIKLHAELRGARYLAARLVEVVKSLEPISPCPCSAALSAHRWSRSRSPELSHAG